MATAEEQELSQKINALADKRYYGQHDVATIKKLFLSYDGDGDGKLLKDELSKMLSDADIGNFVTRGFWVDGIFEKLDKSPKDDALTWEEYLAAKSTSAPPSTPTSPSKPASPASPQQASPLYCDWETNVCSPSPEAANVGNVSSMMWAIPLGLSIGMVWLLARK